MRTWSLLLLWGSESRQRWARRDCVCLTIIYRQQKAKGYFKFSTHCNYLCNKTSVHVRVAAAWFFFFLLYLCTLWIYLFHYNSAWRSAMYNFKNFNFEFALLRWENDRKFPRSRVAMGFITSPWGPRPGLCLDSFCHMYNSFPVKWKKKPLRDLEISYLKIKFVIARSNWVELAAPQ